MKKIKILVVSPQTFFREGVWHVLSMQSDFAVAATADLETDVLAEIYESNPDICLIDIDHLSPSGISVYPRKITQIAPTAGMIFLSSTNDDNMLFQALKARASAYLKKEVSAEDLVQTIRLVAGGEQPIQEIFTTRQKVALQVLHKFQELSQAVNNQSDRSPLTDRETEILRLVAQGLLYALKLGISEQTIKNHITSILRKLNASARTEAVVLAIKQGLITIN